MRILPCLALFVLFLAPSAPGQNFVLDSGSGIPDGAWALSWADYDRDGRLDIAGLAFPGPVTRLWRNFGNGTFEETTATSGIASIGRAHAWADYDGDGWLDLYVPQDGGPAHLYRNEGCGSFREMGVPAGVSLPGRHPMNAAWADYDLDGLADLYVTTLEGGVLFRNDGDGTFHDATAEAGAESFDLAFGLGWGDANGDVRPDLFIDHVFGRPNLLLSNGPSGTFEEIGARAGIQGSDNPYGVGWADYDGDLDFDIFVAAQRRGETRLYRNEGDGTFSNRSLESGIAIPGRSVWGGAAWGDYDADGWIDLVVGDFRTRDLLFRNLGDGTFAESAREEGLSRTGTASSSVAWGDADGDGSLDLATSSGGLYRNQGAAGRGLWLRLVGNASSKDALGARVVASFPGGRVLRQVDSGSSYAGQSGIPGLVHLGLPPGAADARIEIRWPAGEETILESLPRESMIAVVEPGPGNTRVGTDIRVDLTPSLAVVFEEVAQPGTTGMVAEPSGPAAPFGYDLFPTDPSSPDSLHFRLVTTATIRGEIRILLEHSLDGSDSWPLLRWTRSDAFTILPQSVACLPPGWSQWDAQSLGLFALARPAIPIEVVVKPEVFERRSFGAQGLVTAFVTLSSGLSAADLDPARWSLEGASAVQIEEAGDRLILKFRRADLAIPSNGEIVLGLAGRTTDGRLLAGTDQVRVQG